MAWTVFRRGLLAALVLGLASASGASPIGPSCGTCQGSIYDITYGGAPISTTATTETFQITYTVDTSGYDGTGSFLDAVALKVASSFLDATLVSAPGGTANWFEMTGGLNAAGCSGSGSGFDCVAVSSLVGAPVVPGGVYTWVFDIQVPTGTLFTGTGESSVKARYITVDGSGMRHKAGALVSENITLSVPEPGAAPLLLAGAAGLLARRRLR